jgi:RNA polymerase sigma-70 factor, ECF subfamily
LKPLAGWKKSDGDHRHDPDVALMLAFQRGDEEAFVTLYGSYRDRLINFARRILGDRALGEEAAQEVFLKIYAARQRYRPESRLSTYIFRVAKNHCLNLRARREWSAVDREIEAAASPAPGGGQEQSLEGARLRAALSDALARLPESQAVAFVLCQYEGMSLAEAAAVLELSPSAVKSLVFRARQGLMELLRPFAEELSAGQKEARHAVP